MESSDPDIYAVGDAAETMHALTGARARIALAGPANRQGRIAGANAAGARMIYPGALGTSIVRVLNMTAGFTGLNSAQAAKAGFTFFTSLTRDYSHAHYYPGAKLVMIKVIAEEGTGRLLGAQVLGESGVDKRVDVLATAIAAKMSVFDLETWTWRIRRRSVRPMTRSTPPASSPATSRAATSRRVAPETGSRRANFCSTFATRMNWRNPAQLPDAVNIPLAPIPRPPWRIAARPAHRGLLPERPARISGRLRFARPRF